MSVPPSGGESERGAVELTDVTKRFGAMVAVDRLNLSVQPGEFLSLLGPSGCGKTTTLRMLAGFEQPDEGFIRISGEYVQGIPPYKRDVNTVFQAYALFPHMTVAENVAYGLRQKRVPKSEVASRVNEALGMVKMTKLAERRPRQMSGGQQQRVAVARALVNRPSVLLLDEPLGALDRKLREEMQIELKLLQSQLGITFIFVTHDQEEAMSMSNRIAIMLEGHIEQLGDPETVYERPVSAFVAGFIGRNNFWRGTATADGAWLPTTARCSSATVPRNASSAASGRCLPCDPRASSCPAPTRACRTTCSPVKSPAFPTSATRCSSWCARRFATSSCCCHARRRRTCTRVTRCGASGRHETCTSSRQHKRAWCSPSPHPK